MIYLIPPTWSMNSNSIAGANEAPDAPFSNLVLNVRPSLKWRSNNLTEVRGVVRATESFFFNSVALLYANISEAGTWRLVAGGVAGNIWTSPSFDTGHQGFRMARNLDSWTYWHGVMFFDATREHEYVGIEINDPDNSDGFIKAGVLVIGERFTPAYSVSYGAGSEFGYDDTSIEIPLANSETIMRRRPRKANFSFDLPFQRTEDAGIWLGFARTYAASTPVFVIAQTEDIIDPQAYTVYGYLQFRRNRLITKVYPGYYHSNFEVKEV